MSELVANAIVHGRAARGSRVSVTYRLQERGLRVEVRDWATGMPRLDRGAAAPAWDDMEAEGGRGLRMVAALTDRWGVIPRVIGKSVWFELRVRVPPLPPPPPEAPPRTPPSFDLLRRAWSGHGLPLPGCCLRAGRPDPSAPSAAAVRRLAEGA